MKLPISDRLLCCASYLSNGIRIADIGCDHGYLGIHLLKNCNAKCIIAADINEGPLQSAMRNAMKYGTKNKTSFYLSDGVQNIPRDFDTMVCAGMGGDTIMSIIAHAYDDWLADPKYTLILQCQSKTPMLRKYLTENGFVIHREKVLRDGRFLYTVMEILFRPGKIPLTIGQQYFPRALLADPTPETKEYYERLLFSLERAIKGRGEKADPEMIAAYEELLPLKEELK
jgi:tRNA (adenine22-N1)-methyltransferase